MIYHTKIGLIEIKEQNGKITKLHFLKLEELKQQQELQQDKETLLIKQAHQQITEYLEGKRKEFNVPIQMQGTPFQI